MNENLKYSLGHNPDKLRASILKQLRQKVLRSVTRPDEFFQRRWYCNDNVRLVSLWFTHILTLYYSKNKLKENIINVFNDTLNNKSFADENEAIDRNLSILQGLYVIVEKSGCSDLLSSLYEGVFEKWSFDIAHSSRNKIDPYSGLDKLAEKRFKSFKGVDAINQKINKWRIGLISISLKDSETNVNRFADNAKMLTNIINWFKSVKPIDETYIFILRIFQYTADGRNDLANRYRYVKPLV